MPNQRDFIIVIPVLFFWCLMMSSHQKTVYHEKIHVGRLIARLAGSKTDQVSLKAFATQLGYLSMILWYIVFRYSGIAYFSNSALVFSILLGGITILVSQVLLRLRHR